MTEPRQLIRRVLRYVAGLLLAAAVYYFFVARNEGKISPRVGSFVSSACGLIAAVAWIFLQRHWERQFLGSAWRQPFKLHPGEALVFSSDRVGCLLYPRAEDYSPRVPLRVLASEKKPFLGGPYLKLRLTDKRLMLRSWRGNTWRVIPVSSIERVTEARRRFFSIPDRVVIGYRFEGRSEVLVIEDKPARGKTLKEALLALNTFTAAASGPLSVDLPGSIAAP